MHILEQKSDLELDQSLLAEIAKATNEIRCAKADLEKASSRLTFCIAIANELINRKGDSNETK
jgi:hypothetical protein